MRERFWELPLAELTRPEWEALCDGCGQCCTHKLEDEDTGALVQTDVACRLLDTATARCRDYRHRRALVPDCLRLTQANVGKAYWLPPTCAYRRRAEGKPIPDWHPLLSGDPYAAIAAGVSVAGRVVSEAEVQPDEDRLVDWGVSSSGEKATR